MSQQSWYMWMTFWQWDLGMSYKLCSHNSYMFGRAVIPTSWGREPGDVDTLRFLGLDIELGEQEGTWLVHQQSYIHAFLQEMFGDYLKDRRTPGEPDSYSNKPEHHAQKARVKHPVLRPDQDPLEHTPILRLVGVLLWVSLRTRPDISWAVARITRLASSDKSRARVCVKHVAQYLKWTLHFALFYEPVTDRKSQCCTDASWSPEGDYSHQAVAINYDTNLVAWQSQRQSLVALSSAEAELIASVWGNRLALSLYGQLMEMILDKPTYITYCDNAAVVQLTQQLSASKTRTRHLSYEGIMASSLGTERERECVNAICAHVLPEGRYPHQGTSGIYS